MTALPPRVRDFLDALESPKDEVAYLGVDAAGIVVLSGGRLASYDLEHVAPGQVAVESVPFLAGMLPLGREAFHAAPMQLGPDRWTELHLLPGADGTAWVVLLDCTEEARSRQDLQQRGNELALAREKSYTTPGSASLSGLYAHVVNSLGIAIFVHTRANRFSVETAPHWLSSVLEGAEPGLVVDAVERFPFLESFMPEAESVWADPIPGIETSGIWVEQQAGGLEIPIEALATRSQSDKLLLLRIPWAEYEEKRELVTRARSSSLEHDRLRKEIQKKEILLHCIVHDLSNPLSGIEGVFQLLDRQELPPDAARHVALGRRMCADQQRLIGSILDTFSAELSSPSSGPLDPSRVTDAGAVLRKVVDTLLPTATLRQRSLCIAPAAGGALSLCAAIDDTGLERMLLNLTENALRHAPSGGTVVLGVEELDEGQLQFTVEDDGPGIPPDQAEHIFEKFHRDGAHRGTAGLGLYFCKITSERWGGQIGYENRAEGGSRFWFRLPVWRDG